MGLAIRSRLWLRPVVVVGLLGTCVYVAPRLSLFHLLVLLGLAGFLVLLRWPVLGLLALIPIGQLVPLAVGTGTQTKINSVALLLPLLAALWAVDRLVRRDFRSCVSRTIPPLLLFCAVAVLAFLAGAEPWFLFAQNAPLRTQMGQLAIFLLSAGAFLLAAHLPGGARHLQILTWLFLAAGALYATGRVLPVATGQFFQKGADGSLFWVWLAALSFSQAISNRALPATWRLGLALLTAAIFYIGLSPASIDWTSGWLPPLVAVVVAAWVATPKMGLLVTLAIGLLMVLDPSHVGSLLMVGDNQYSLNTRVEAWIILQKIVEISPVLGLGPANYYHYTPLFPIEGYAVTFNSHNNYVDLVAQTGLLGLFCFLWFAFEAGRLGWHLRKRAPTEFQRAYVCGALGGLAGTLTAAMLGDWLLPFVYNIGFDGFRASVVAWVFLGGLVAIEQTVERRTGHEVSGS